MCTSSPQKALRVRDLINVCAYVNMCMCLCTCLCFFVVMFVSFTDYIFQKEA